MERNTFDAHTQSAMGFFFAGGMAHHWNISDWNDKVRLRNKQQHKFFLFFFFLLKVDNICLNIVFDLLQLEAYTKHKTNRLESNSKTAIPSEAMLFISSQQKINIQSVFDLAQNWD